MGGSRTPKKEGSRKKQKVEHEKEESDVEEDAEDDEMKSDSDESSPDASSEDEVEQPNSEDDRDDDDLEDAEEEEDAEERDDKEEIESENENESADEESPSREESLVRTKKLSAAEAKKRKKIQDRVPDSDPGWKAPGEEITLRCHQCGEHKQWNAPMNMIVPAPEDIHYTFTCLDCSEGEPELIHDSKTWMEIALTTTFNLERTLQRQYFHSKTEICEFVDVHWKVMCKGKSRTPTWWATLHAMITQNRSKFKTPEYGSGFWACISRSPEKGKGATPRRSRPPKPRKRSRPSNDDGEVAERSKEVEFRVVTEGGVYVVEDIVGKRTVEETTQYLLKWKGYSHDDNTWEDIDNMNCQDLILNFEKKISRSQKRKAVEGGKKKKAKKTRRAPERVTCHLCQQRLPREQFPPACQNSVCLKNWCQECLENELSVTLSELKETWICPYCRRECLCLRCLKRAGKSTTSSPTRSPESGNFPEKIIARGISDGQLQLEKIYFLKWTDGNFSWESAGNSLVSSDMIQEFSRASCKIRLEMSLLYMDEQEQIRREKRMQKRAEELEKLKLKKLKKRDPFDIDRMVSFPTSHRIVQKIEQETISIPQWKEIMDDVDVNANANGHADVIADVDDIVDVDGIRDDESSDEDTSDERYLNLHTIHVLEYEKNLWNPKKKTDKGR